MMKSELIDNIAKQQLYLSHKDVEASVNLIIEWMYRELENGGRIYIRRFGSFSIRKRREIMGRNPQNGQAVLIKARHVVHFKAAQELKSRIDQSSKKYLIQG